ncbi:peroxin-12 [Microdochium nivale]|nr:peroxin-12 [Microdochium nivale]
MAAPRRALASTGCSSCRSAVLRLFATELAVPVPVPVPVLARPRLAPRLAPAQSARLTTPAVRLYSTPTRQPDSQANTESLEQPTGTTDGADAADVVSVPWYLQVEPPRHVATLEPPPLPPVPDNAPPILSSILRYAAEELGLDELSLLDLRELDPAPALGANLFMLFGTARSERHLNVSAGRFVRFLRAKHRVHADADGLLGPNERKTKLRRKARKAKLLQIMGTDETDDGMRTGWVCVNLGTIGRSGPETANVGEDGRLTGFGTAREGTSIVFQIMTESRRAEMNLEALWSSTLDAYRTSQATAELPAPDAKTSPQNPANSLQSPTRPSLADGQVRRTTPNETVSFSTARPSGRAAALMGSVESLPLAYEEPGKLAQMDEVGLQRVLNLLHNFLKHGPKQQVAAATGGRPAYAAQETPFTELFDATVDRLSSAQTWACRLTFHAKCVETNPHDSAHASVSQTLLQDMQLHGIVATREQYMELLGAIWKAQQPDIRETEMYQPARTDLALSLLNTMQQRGHSVLANDVIVSLLESTMAQKRPASTLIASLWDLAAQARLPCMDEASLVRLLTASSRIPDKDYSMFWDVWQAAPRYLQSRSADLYLHILRLAARTRRSQHCAQVVRRCVLDMPNEIPPVVLDGRLVTALRDCIKVADPMAEVIAAKLPPGADTPAAKSEFVRMLTQLNAMQQ